MIRILVTLALSAYNNVANLWPPFNRAAYVPANVGATAVLAVVAVLGLDLTAEELGVGGLSAVDFAVGLSLGAVVGGVVLLAGRIGWGARLIADRRVVGLRGRALVYQTLVRVPLGTALLEEFAFRGVLFAAWRDEGTLTAALVSSFVFGLWHIMPSTVMVRTNDPEASRAKIAGTIAATVVGTTVVGLGFMWLRVETGSLAAPFALHATVNSLATWAGVLAGRRTRATS